MIERRKNILHVDCDRRSNSFVRAALNIRDEFSVSWIPHLAESLIFIQTNSPHVVLFDPIMPESDVQKVLQLILQHSKHKGIPAIVFSKPRSPLDVVKALNAGADDYFRKPFYVAELRARVRAVLRRAPQVTTFRSKKSKPIVLDVGTHGIRVDGDSIILTRMEFDLIKILMDRAGSVVRYSEFESALSANENRSYINSRTIQAHICHLREKLLHYRIFLKTVAGVGFTFLLPGT